MLGLLGFCDCTVLVTSRNTQFDAEKMSQMIREFAQSLTKKEKSYLWDHVYRYAGVEGTTAEEHQSCNESSFGFQFGRLVEYVLNFLTGDCELEKKIFAKALKPKAASEALLWSRCTRTRKTSRAFGPA